MLCNELNMNGAHLTPKAVIHALVLAYRATGEYPEYARAHPYAIAQWENNAYVCAVTIVNRELSGEELDSMKHSPKTMCGKPLHSDPKMYPDRVLFYNAKDKQIAAIVGLPVRAGFEPNEETAKDWLFE